jgi:MoxR-like ATPase
MVVATQNPVEMEGTYPLPEAQLDRFLMLTSVGLPTRDVEIQILRNRSEGNGVEILSPVTTSTDVQAMIKVAETVHIADAAFEYIVDLANALRAQTDQLALAVSPRGSLALVRATRARAMLHGREYVSADDIQALVHPVWRHRLILTHEARVARVSSDDVLNTVLEAVPVPTER